MGKINNIDFLLKTEKFMLLILFFLLIAIITLKIRVEFNKLEISNLDEKEEKTELRKIYNLDFKIYIFNIIRIIKINFDNKKSEETLIKIKDQIGKMSGNILNYKELIKRLQEFKVRIKEARVKLLIGTEDILLTVGVVAGISTIIPIWLIDKIGSDNARKIQYRIIPIYNRGNIMHIEGEGIIETNLVHIIYALYIFKMKGRSNENGRTESKSSDRRTYDYSNE